MLGGAWLLGWEWVTLGSAEDEWEEVGDGVIFDAAGVLDQKGCKPKCRFSQAIILGKYEVDPQGMVDTK